MWDTFDQKILLWSFKKWYFYLDSENAAVKKVHPWFMKHLLNQFIKRNNWLAESERRGKPREVFMCPEVLGNQYTGLLGYTPLKWLKKEKKMFTIKLDWCYLQMQGWHSERWIKLEKRKKMTIKKEFFVFLSNLCADNGRKWGNSKIKFEAKLSRKCFVVKKKCVP